MSSSDRPVAAWESFYEVVGRAVSDPLEAVQGKVAAAMTKHGEEQETRLRALRQHTDETAQRLTKLLGEVGDHAAAAGQSAQSANDQLGTIVTAVDELRAGLARTAEQAQVSTDRMAQAMQRSMRYQRITIYWMCTVAAALVGLGIVVLVG